MRYRPLAWFLVYCVTMIERMHITETGRKVLAAASATVLLGGIGVGALIHFTNAPHIPHDAKVAAMGSGINLLDQDWNSNGISKEDGTLHVAATDSKIVNQDGSGGQSNPTVNSYGTHLQTSGDFAVTAHITKRTDGSASVRLYDKPPIIADEFRLEPASIAVTEQNSALSVRVWDGSQPKSGEVTDPQPAFTHSANLSDTNGNIVISRVGSDLRVQDGDTVIIDHDGAKPFTSGNVWIGLSSPDSGFTVDKLIAQGLNHDTVTTIDTAAEIGKAELSSTGLQALANKIRPGFTVGAAAALGPWMSDDTYRNQLTQNFGGITLENAMKPQFISPKQGVYTFQEADALIALAQKNGMKVHGHTLAFTEGLPHWMRSLPTSTEAERQQSGKILLDYVRTVMTHFKGKFATLDVINEPLDPDQGSQQQPNIWSKVFGNDYGAIISKTVYDVDPDVLQTVNENGIEMPGDRQDAFLAYVQRVNALGGHIGGVGLQAHVYDMSTDAIDASSLNDTINRFGAAGFKVRISENDVTDDSGTTAQAAQFATIFITCLRNKNCISYTTWGINDNYDWFIDDNGSLQQGHDLLFNGASPTSAYAALQNSLK
jgi:endo-1,4-beta-xylanase